MISFLYRKNVSCRDCKWCQKNDNDKCFDKCFSPKVKLIIGNEDLPNLCIWERSPGFIKSLCVGKCGKYARYFNSRKKK